jgi:hypothetical protein
MPSGRGSLARAHRAISIAVPVVITLACCNRISADAFCCCTDLRLLEHSVFGQLIKISTELQASLFLYILSETFEKTRACILFWDHQIDVRWIYVLGVPSSMVESKWEPRPYSTARSTWSRAQWFFNFEIKQKQLKMDVASSDGRCDKVPSGNKVFNRESKAVSIRSIGSIG